MHSFIHSFFITYAIPQWRGCHKHWRFSGKVFLKHYLRWLRELNVLQLQKTHANRKSTSKSRKDFHQFDSRWWKCSQHKQMKKHTENAHNKCYLQRVCFLVVLWAFAACVVKLTKAVFLICSAFLFWLCCEHLQCVCCQNDENCFLNLQVFFFFICSTLSSLDHRNYPSLSTQEVPKWHKMNTQVQSCDNVCILCCHGNISKMVSRLVSTCCSGSTFFKCLFLLQRVRFNPCTNSNVLITS